MIGVLTDITIEDLGVIHKSSAELADGLTVLTGETGAGKTMVVTGLRLLAGARADASRVRSGAKKAVVEGTFATPSQRAAEIVEQSGGQPDDNGEFITTRAVWAAGRSKAHLGGRAVPAATLAEFTGEVLTIHGQNDQLRLLAPEQQLAALDRSDEALPGLREAYTEKFTAWRKLARELKRKTQSRREMAQEVDRLQFAVDEIDKVSPVDGEDTELVEQIRRLQDVDALREAATTALAGIDGPDGIEGADGAEAAGGYAEQEAASTQLGSAAAALAASSDSHLQALGERMHDITAQLADISGELGLFLGQLPADPDLLEKSLVRQQELKQLTRKYAPDIQGVIVWRDEAVAKLGTMDVSSEALEELKKDVAAAEKEMIAAAEVLTRERTRAAGDLAAAVTQELRGLAMPKARIEVAVRPAKYSRTGADEVEIAMAPNDAADARPLASAASGGELSRVMLALEVILSADNEGGTMVFDEVDAGVGGRAAVEIGRRLAKLARNHQVIVVTHLPQVAAYADCHLHVAKEVSDETVTSGVSNLDRQERIEELARMLAGLDDTATGRAHAAELFDKAQAEVASFRAP